MWQHSQRIANIILIQSKEGLAIPQLWRWKRMSYKTHLCKGWIMAPIHRIHQLLMCSIHLHDHWTCPHQWIPSKILSNLFSQMPLWQSRSTNPWTHSHAMRPTWAINKNMQQHHQQLHPFPCGQPISLSFDNGWPSLDMQSLVYTPPLPSPLSFLFYVVSHI